MIVTELPESTYHYHLSKKNEPNEDKGLEELIQEIFEENKERYGYRRITDELMLTSSRNRHFLPISFPQILPDKIRHFLSNQKLFVDVSFDNSRRPFEPILLGGEGGRGLLLRPLHRLRVHPTDPGSYLKSV